MDSKIQNTNKYQKCIACSYGYKLVCVNYKFSKTFKTYFGKDVICNLLNSMIEESKYWSNMMKKHFNKELSMTNEDIENFKSSNFKYWICDNDYVDTDVRVRDHCHITGKYRGSAHRDCNINLKLNHKIPVVFQNLKNYDSHLIMEELDKFNLKNVLPNGLEKYMSFNINNKLSFIDSFQILRSSLDSLVKNLNKDDFKYSSQELDNNVSDLVKQKRILPL